MKEIKQIIIILSLAASLLGKPVIDIIYNSLDLDSQFFIEISLGNALINNVSIFDWVDINLYPGGNCHISTIDPSSYQCTPVTQPLQQHDNYILLCLMDILEKQDEKENAFQYIYCLETQLPGTFNFDDVGYECASMIGLDEQTFDDIQECSNDGYGQKLMDDNWYNIKSLPTKGEVLNHLPYIFVDTEGQGKPVYDKQVEQEIIFNLLQYVCLNVKGAGDADICR